LMRWDYYSFVFVFDYT